MFLSLQYWHTPTKSETMLMSNAMGLLGRLTQPTVPNPSQQPSQHEFAADAGYKQLVACLSLHGLAQYAEGLKREGYEDPSFLADATADMLVAPHLAPDLAVAQALIDAANSFTAN
eukprot:m.117002 g.117002  ORF g.117002 m.117002 type:complete len:116 (-) comp15413_c0_seq14:4042-4389(-)